MQKKTVIVIVCLMMFVSFLEAKEEKVLSKHEDKTKITVTQQVVKEVEQVAKITGININDGAEKLSVSILTDRNVKRNAYRSLKPYSIVMDIFPAVLSIKDKSFERNKDGIKKITFSVTKKNVVRVTITLNKLLEYDISVKENVTAVNITKEKEIVIAKAEVPQKQEPKPEVKPIEKPVEATAKIDEKATKVPISKPITPAKTEEKIIKTPTVASSLPEPTKTKVVSVKTEVVSSEDKEEIKPAPKKKRLQKGNLDQLVTLELVNADLLTTLRAIADDIDYNIIASKSVVGTVTLTLRDVPLRRALDAMLNMNNLSYVVENNIIEIGTTAELSSGDEQGKLITQSFVLNFTKAESIQTPLKAVLSKNGSMQMDARTNTLIVTDTMPKLRQVSNMIKELDTSVKQVMIEATLVEVSASKENEFGIKWQATKGAGTAAGTTPTSNLPELDYGMQSQPAGVSAGFPGVLQIGTIAGGNNLGIVLNALASTTDANILANPRVATLDGKIAKINITTEYQYVSAFNATTGIPTYASVSTGIILEVTPQVNTSGWITMKVKPSVSSVVNPGPPPVVDRRETETEVLVKDGDTIVIGGLLKEEEITKLSKVPFLGDIPLIGFLFKDKFTQKAKKDLQIFITPHILPMNQKATGMPVDE